MNLSFHRFSAIARVILYDCAFMLFPSSCLHNKDHSSVSTWYIIRAALSLSTLPLYHLSLL